MSTSDSTDSAQASPESACRLAVYGTLAPGRANHHQLAGLSGRWIEGAVWGQLREAGWGAYLGYPAIVLDVNGPEVGVQVFESPDLPEHWDRLDRFEGPAYQRAVTTVHTAEGDLLASIYELAPTDPRGGHSLDSRPLPRPPSTNCEPNRNTGDEIPLPKAGTHSKRGSGSVAGWTNGS